MVSVCKKPLPKRGNIKKYIEIGCTRTLRNINNNFRWRPQDTAHPSFPQQIQRTGARTTAA